MTMTLVHGPRGSCFSNAYYIDRSVCSCGHTLFFWVVWGEQEMTAACTDATTPMQFGMATAMATEVLKHDFDTMHM